MKEFFLKIMLLFLLVTFIILFILLLPPNNTIRSTNLFAQPVKNNLLKNTPNPRIIFLGGSNISFGLNSQMIKDSLGLNPVNMGIHASIGLKFMLRNSLHYIKEGDIIVIVPEYDQFYGNLADGDINLLSIELDVLHQFKDLDIKQLISLSKYIPEYAYSKLHLLNYFKAIDTSYTNIVGRNSFNKYGDAFIHWSLPKPKNFVSYNIDASLNNDVFEFLDDFREKINDKKALLYITFPCFEENCFSRNYSQILAIENKLKEKGFNILGSPERYSMNDSLIFNTAYHLTKKGVDLRTSLLIKDLKTVIPKKNEEF
jgi:hypothetical protein